MFVYFQPGYWGYDMRRNMDTDLDVYGELYVYFLIQNYQHISCYRKSETGAFIAHIFL